MQPNPVGLWAHATVKQVILDLTSLLRDHDVLYEPDRFDQLSKELSQTATALREWDAPGPVDNPE